MARYLYLGPVTQFGRCIANKWSGETWATSPSKARSNFIFRIKKELGLTANSRVELPGKIKEIE